MLISLHLSGISNDSIPDNPYSIKFILWKHEFLGYVNAQEVTTVSLSSEY